MYIIVRTRLLPTQYTVAFSITPVPKSYCVV